MNYPFLLTVFLFCLSGSEQTSIPRKHSSLAAAASISLITAGVVFFEKISCNGLYCLSSPLAPPSPPVIHADFYLRCTVEDYLVYYRSTIVQCTLNSSNPVEVFPSIAPPEEKVFELRQKDLAHQAQLQLILENLNKPSPTLTTSISSAVRLVPDEAKHFINHAKATVPLRTRSVWRKVKHLPAWAEKEYARANKRRATIYERGSELILRALKSISVWLEGSVRETMNFKKSAWIVQVLGNFILHKPLILDLWNLIISLFKRVRSCYLWSLPYGIQAFHAYRPVVSSVYTLFIKIFYSVLKLLTSATLSSIWLMLRVLFWSAEKTFRVCIALPAFSYHAFTLVQQIHWGCTTTDDRPITLLLHSHAQNTVNPAIELTGDENSEYIRADSEIRASGDKNNLFKALPPRYGPTEMMGQFIGQQSWRYGSNGVLSCFSIQDFEGDNGNGEDVGGDDVEEDHVEQDHFEKAHVEGDIVSIEKRLRELEISDYHGYEQTPEFQYQPTSSLKASKRVTFAETVVPSIGTFSPDAPGLTIKVNPTVQEKGPCRPELIILTTVCSTSLVPERKKDDALAEKLAPSLGTILSAALVSANPQATVPVIDLVSFTPSADAILTSNSVKQPRKASQSVQRSPLSKRFDPYRRACPLKKNAPSQMVSPVNELAFANAPSIRNISSASNGPSSAEDSTPSNVLSVTNEAPPLNVTPLVNGPFSANELFPSVIIQKAISQWTRTIPTTYKSLSQPNTSRVPNVPAPQPCIPGAPSVLDFCKAPRAKILKFPVAVPNNMDQTDEMDTSEDYTCVVQAATQTTTIAAPAPVNKEDQTDEMDTSEDETSLGQAATQFNAVTASAPASLSARSQNATTAVAGSGYQAGVLISYPWTPPPPQPYNLASAMNLALHTLPVQPIHSGTAPPTSLNLASFPKPQGQSNFTQPSQSRAVPPTPLGSTVPANSTQGLLITQGFQSSTVPSTSVDGSVNPTPQMFFPQPAQLSTVPAKILSSSALLNHAPHGASITPGFQSSTVPSTSVDGSVNPTPQMLFPQPAQLSTVQAKIPSSSALLNHAPQGDPTWSSGLNFEPNRERSITKGKSLQKSLQWIDSRKGSSLTSSISSTPPTSSIVAPGAVPPASFIKSAEMDVKINDHHAVAMPMSDPVETKNAPKPTQTPPAKTQDDGALRIAAEKNKESPNSGELRVSTAKKSVETTNPNLKVSKKEELNIGSPPKDTKVELSQISSSDSRLASSQRVPSSSSTKNTPPKIPGLENLPLDKNQPPTPLAHSSTGIATPSSGHTAASFSGLTSSQRFSACPRPSAGRPKQYMKDSIWSVKKQPMTDKEIAEVIRKEDAEVAKKKAADSRHINAGNYFLAAFPNGHETIDTPSKNICCGLYAIMKSMGAQFPKLRQPTMPELENILRRPQPTLNKGVARTSHTANLTANELATILHFWGQEHGLNLDLGYIAEGKDPLIICASENTAEERQVLWVHNGGAAAMAAAEGFDHCGLLNHWSGLKPPSKAEAENAKIETLTADLEKIKEEMKAKTEEENDSEPAGLDFGSEIYSHSSHSSEPDYDRGDYSDSGTNDSLNSDSDPAYTPGSESNSDSDSTSDDGSDPSPADDWEYSPPGSPYFPSWSPQFPPLNNDSGSDSGSDISEFLLPETETEHHVDVPGITTQFLDPDDEGVIFVYKHWAMTTANGQKWIKMNAQWLRNHRKTLIKDYPEMKDPIMKIISRDNAVQDVQKMKKKKEEAKAEAEANKKAF